MLLNFTNHPRSIQFNFFIKMNSDVSKADSVDCAADPGIDQIVVPCGIPISQRRIELLGTVFGQALASEAKKDLAYAMHAHGLLTPTP